MAGHDDPWLTEMTATLAENMERLATLASATRDANARVPASPDWTVHDVFAHLSTVVPRYADGPEGSGEWVADPRELGGLNDKQLQSLASSELPDVVASIRRSLKDLLDQIQGYGSHPPSFRFHGGSQVRADVALGILLGEFLIHGRDIAQAINHLWPIQPRHAVLVIEGVTPILPSWVNRERARGLTAIFDVRLRKQARYLWSFVEGELEVSTIARQHPHVHISADPTAFLLVLYRRESQWKYILTGRMFAYGRKPWLALTLKDRFLRP